MADIGERLGGDDLNFSIDQPLRIIIGGPPHSGKSTLMNLLEDRFQYYQIPVQLLDLDLSAPTPLKTGFTQQREKRKWTSTLAEEAKSMFEQAEGVQVVLGDSVGLISEINEIISQPADVAILLVSGGHGDYDDTYRKVVRKWKEYYEDIRTPLLVVLRSTMNPRDESMFDPRDNYGVIAGLDRDAYQSKVISGHYQYAGEYPTNACLEGIVFEIAQSFDLKVRSATDPEHLAILNQKWPDLKDKKTWTPPADSMLGGIERAYFEERGRVPADQRAEYYTKYYLPNRLDPKVGDEAMFEGGEIRITNMERNPDVIFYTYLDEDGKSDGFIHTRDIAKFVDRWSPFPMEKESFGADFKVGMDGDFEDHEEGEVGSEHLVTYTLDNGIVAPVFEGYTIMSKDGMNSGKRIDGYLIGIAEDNQWWQPEGGVPTRSEINEVFGAESFSADGWDSYTVSYREEEDDPHFEVDDDYDDLNEAMSAYQHFINTGMNSVMIAGYTLNEKGDYEEDSKPVAEYSKGAYDNRPQGYSAEDDLSFKEWADQEMLTHGKKESFDDWLNDELSHHGDNMTLQDWGQHELDSHYERYGAEEKIHSQLMIGSLIGLGAGLWAVNRFKESREEQ